MKSKELLVARLEEHVAPALAELGFRFARSRPSFTRTVGGFRQLVEFSTDRWNKEDVCEFHSGWTVSSAAYAKWYRATWGVDASSDVIVGLNDWRIPGWRVDGIKRRRLTNTPQDAQVASEFLFDLRSAGLAFLERASTFEGAAELLLADRWHFDQAADLLLVAERRDLAHKTLLEGVRTFEVEGRPDNFRELPGLRERLAKFFPDA
ncbi:MAG: DUF4304 domain-containing protein [Planctomycetes bacterium]|nr:DUF4304 domain-containing protein [Planctomycetota bacterium]